MAGGGLEASLLPLALLKGGRFRAAVPGLVFLG